MIAIAIIIILEMLRAVSRKEHRDRLPGMNLGSSCYYVILGSFLTVSVPQFPHVQNSNANKTHFIEFLGLSKLIFAKHLV